MEIFNGHKMIKRVLTAIISAALALSALPAAAGEYFDFETIKPHDSSQLVYEIYDITDIEEIADKVEALLSEPNNGMELSVYLDEAYKELLKFYDARTLAQIEADRFCNTENINKSLDAGELSLKAFHIFDNMLYAVYKSEYSSLLDDVLGREEVENYINAMHSDAYYKLVNEEKLLVSSYNEKIGDSDACANLFIKLAALRRKIAEEEGYESYADYAHHTIYGRSYSDKEIANYENAVIEYIVPLYRSLVEIKLKLNDNYQKQDDAVFLAKLETALEHINPELKLSYQYMINNHLYDIEYRDGKTKEQSAYTAQLYTYKLPYVFMSYSADSNKRLRAFIHEFGHFSAALNSLNQASSLWNMQPLSIDTCEIHSQGLEVLCEPEYGKLFGKAAAYERVDLLFTMVGNIINGCMFNEWQTLVYNEDAITKEQANEYAVALFKKYYGKELSADAAQKLWTDIGHNFHSPMYYLGYSLSAVAALELYPSTAEARDDYMRLLSLGTCVPLYKAVEQTGINSVFAPSTLKTIAENINSSIGRCYNDVSYIEWYVPYLYRTAAVYDSDAANCFSPQREITREEFVRLIGKMYDYYMGISGDYSLKFKDMDKNSDAAKYIAWANANDIVQGYSEDKFGGGDTMTREQLVSVLYRLNSQKADRSVLEQFPDNKHISAWAEDAMAWAVENGIISGRENSMLDPQATATRAEAAKIVACYIDLAF